MIRFPKKYLQEYGGGPYRVLNTFTAALEDSITREYNEKIHKTIDNEKVRLILIVILTFSIARTNIMKMFILANVIFYTLSLFFSFE